MNKQKILLVEDHVDTRFLYRKILTKEGYDVVMACNGEEALEILRKEFIGLILTDWLMPIIDGVELVKIIRSEFTQQPVIIVLTAVNSNEARNKVMLAGADEFVAKPVDNFFLLEIIKDTISKNNFNPKIEEIEPIIALSQMDYYCVGIAASTGGPSTLIKFFKNIGVINNAAFLVVQHGQEWMLKTFAKSLQQNINMPVHLGSDNLEIKPGNVYLAPGDKHMVIVKNSAVLEFLDTPPENFVRPSADPLFKSIASAFGNKSIGVVLTGMGRDGSIGAGYISAAGGTIIAENPQTAILPSMPNSVIKLNLADHVVHVSEIKKVLDALLV
ncbi:MAG: hypothetical protein CVV23_04775 [Ignavibacteriae bacterium HGW-Ignavibacteriae-2]|jgi:two-component system chemotaxis response regulator CheB|nr:MAG: hypothetical protein CVV23_04775 [Ignavibacteriae bacterium HGW-Ignavibacteriae-2]